MAAAKKSLPWKEPPDNLHELMKQMNDKLETNKARAGHATETAACDQHSTSGQGKNEQDNNTEWPESKLLSQNTIPSSSPLMAAAKKSLPWKEPPDNLHELMKQMNDKLETYKARAGHATEAAACDQHSTSGQDKNEQDNNTEKPGSKLLSQNTIPSSSPLQVAVALVQPATGVVNSNNVFKEMCELLGCGDKDEGQAMVEKMSLNIAACLQWKNAVCKAQLIPPIIEFCESIPSGHLRMLIQGHALYYDGDVLLNIEQWSHTCGVVSAKKQSNQKTQQSKQGSSYSGMLLQDTANSKAKGESERLRISIDAPLPTATGVLLHHQQEGQGLDALPAVDIGTVHSVERVRSTGKNSRSVFENRGFKKACFKMYNPSAQDFI